MGKIVFLVAPKNSCIDLLSVILSNCQLVHLSLFFCVVECLPLLSPAEQNQCINEWAILLPYV